MILSIDFDSWSTYNFEKKRVVPFLYGGFTYHYLLQSSFPNISTESENGNFESSSSFSDGEITEIRRRTNLSLTLGGGLKFKLVRNYLVIDFRINRWMQNVVRREDRYAIGRLVHGFGHVDSDFTFDTFSALLSYEIPLYQPKRRKNPR